MFRHSRFATFLWLLAVVLLPVRMANAHFHMCLDGQEAPVSFHMQDGATHGAAEQHADGHNDRDVDASLDASISKPGNLADEALFVATALSIEVAAPVFLPTAAIHSRSTPTVASVFALHPPSRGPPL